ncbi:MAG: amidase family protein [Peptococcales bacterium]|jgi:aspartyl-tRNA(Asn)/glutamyl-tRNA(Gln) amidotransferase subunit A
MDFCQLTAHECKELIAKKELSSYELTNSFLQRIEEVEEQVKAFNTVAKDEALAQAKKVDEKIKGGEIADSLAGIPLAIKDNICTEGFKTTCSSKMLNNFIPPYNATVVTKLLQAGNIIIGKTNMSEFGIGSSLEGSAKAVANNEAVFSVSTDTSGEILRSAGFYGLVGLKPTYGAVSRYGLIATASTLDQIGPITKDVTDCALVMNLLAGFDSLDSTSANIDYPDYTQFLVNDIKGMRIGVLREHLEEGMIKNAAKKLEDLGMVVEEISLPYSEFTLPAFEVIKACETSSNLARFDGVRFGYRTEGAEDVLSMFCRTRAEGFGSEVKEQILSGTYYLTGDNYNTYYLKALKVRALIKNALEEVFKKYDCLLMSTQQDTSAILANLVGLPALNVPFGQLDNKPLGIQFMGKVFSEGTLLKIAYNLEQGRE